MRTILDDLAPCVLESLAYRDELWVFVAELTVGEPEGIGGSFEGDQNLPLSERIERELRRSTRPTWVDQKSRRIVIKFGRVVAWQVVDESFTTLDDYEKRDGMDILRVLGRSRYLDYIRQHHGWFEDLVGPAKHYRVCTLNDIVDVVAHDAPIVEPWYAAT